MKSVFFFYAFQSRFSVRLDNIIILSPFVYYFFLINTRLFPVEYHDAFAYLWRQELTIDFFWGRSLTQRIIYALCLNKPAIIANVQLSLYALLALILYHLLKRENKTYNIGLLLTISFLFSSYIFNISAIIINSEPIYLFLLILFPIILFLWPDKYRPIVIFSCGILYILSKNVAPYMMLLLLFMHFWLEKNTNSKKMLLVYALLTSMVLMRLFITHTYDTSIHLNVANNIFIRVFNDSKTTTFFHKKYGMPVGPFVKECQNHNVNEPCIDENPVFRVNWHTRNYELIDDQYGLVKWIKLKGQRSYIQYILFYNISETYDYYHRAFIWFYDNDIMRFLYDYLNYNPEKHLLSNKLLLNQNGFFGFEPFAIVIHVLGFLGFHYIPMICLYIIVGLLMTYFSRYKSYMALAVTLLLSSLALFFLSLFGDAMELTRHVFPTYVLLSFGGFLFVFSLLEIASQMLLVRLNGNHRYERP